MYGGYIEFNELNERAHTVKAFVNLAGVSCDSEETQQFTNLQCPLVKLRLMQGYCIPQRIRTNYVESPYSNPDTTRAMKCTVFTLR